METVPVILKFEQKDGILYVTLPATEGWTSQQWIDYFRSNGIKVDQGAEKILSEDLKPTTDIVTKVAIVTSKAVKNPNDYTFERAFETAIANRLGELTLENACQLRKLLSEEQLAEFSLQAITLAFPNIKTHGPEYIKPGAPQSILIGSHLHHGNYFYCQPYGGNQTLGDNNGTAFAVSQN